MAAIVRVWVDGVERRDVVAFDTREGWCECYRRDAFGKLVMANDKLEIIKLTGKVEAVGAVG